MNNENQGESDEEEDEIDDDEMCRPMTETNQQ